MANITVLGAGRMGTALAKAFLKAGHSVTVWNRSPKADASTQSTLAPGYVTVKHLLAMSREYAIDASLPEALFGVFQRAIDKGHSQDDIAAAFEGLQGKAR